ncbi:hypothetical protein MAPG_02306 [Magnaporthiopsis poae ATCC 64411]|uniref:Uncharacterized protein n=1 Tax=Magnaporthiopsis poae (strain ATCC 64411 / 73-15) TaxID=644358 RepID=A0A0C4DR07_MAGP6|nr:hypothetical protein MAPG_02306 [Magnaporthiopsis poae ATCC 64411]
MQEYYLGGRHHTTEPLPNNRRSGPVIGGGPATELDERVLSGFAAGSGYTIQEGPSSNRPGNGWSLGLSARCSAGGGVAAVVNITDRLYDAIDIAARLDVQRFEYREMLDSYLARATGPGVPRSFHELYYPNPNNNSSTRGKDFLVLPAQYEYISSASSLSTSDAAYTARKRGIADLTNSLHATFASHNLDAIIYPEQKNLVARIGSPSQAGRNGILAALTGFPVVAAPAGFGFSAAASTDDDGDDGDAPAGVPIGIEILGLPWSEGKLLGIARALADLLAEGPVIVGGSTRIMPPFANASVETRAYAAVPEIVPNRGNIPAAYPLGTLA